MQKYKKLFLSYPCCPFLSGELGIIKRTETLELGKGFGTGGFPGLKRGPSQK